MQDINETLNERQTTHGDFKNQAQAAQELKYVFSKAVRASDNKLTVVELEAVDMILHKLARVASGNPHHPDHWHDIAGYATLVEKDQGGQDV